MDAVKKWDDIPDFMQNDEVRKYYNILKKKKFSLIFKRIFDISAAIVLVVILSPILLVVSVWIKIDSKGPIFYRQERITQYGKVFCIFKFRTMVSNADQIGALVTTQGDPRITKVGNKIRKCRLDEIPQLFNVLFGDMSFVGTRPEVKKYVDAYTDEMKATLLLPAGITSLASLEFKEEDKILSENVNKKHSIDEVYKNLILPNKMILNLNYIIDFSVFNDIRLCIKTVL